MQLTWYGNASLVLQEEDTVIAFDPFSGIPVTGFPDNARELPYTQEFRNAKNVFVTHGHFDHIYHIPRLYHDLEVTVYCTKTPYRTLCGKDVSTGNTTGNSTGNTCNIPCEKLCMIAPGWQGDIGPFHITAYQGRHCRFDMPLILRKLFSSRTWKHLAQFFRLFRLHAAYPENGEILFYEVACKGKRIQIMGSMNLDADTIYPTEADLLILPLQGRSDQNKYALQFVEKLKSKQVMLDHYDDAFAPLTDEIDTSGFVKNVRERFGIVCKPLQKGETIYE